MPPKKSYIPLKDPLRWTTKEQDPVRGLSVGTLTAILWISFIGFDEERKKWRIGWLENERRKRNLDMPAQHTKEYSEMKDTRPVKNGMRTAFLQHYKDEDKPETIAYHFEDTFVSLFDKSAAGEAVRVNFIESSAFFFTRVKKQIQADGSEKWVGKGAGRNIVTWKFIALTSIKLHINFAELQINWISKLHFAWYVVFIKVQFELASQRNNQSSENNRIMFSEAYGRQQSAHYVADLNAKYKTDAEWDQFNLELFSYIDEVLAKLPKSKAIAAPKEIVVMGDSDAFTDTEDEQGKATDCDETEGIHSHNDDIAQRVLIHSDRTPLYISHTILVLGEGLCTASLSITSYTGLCE